MENDKKEETKKEVIVLNNPRSPLEVKNLDKNRQQGFDPSEYNKGCSCC
jgi:hypothetical protein